MPVQVKKRKAKKLRRREFRSVGTVSFEFEINTLARTEIEAENIVRGVLDDFVPPTRKRVKIGKRFRSLKEGVDYFVYCTAGTELSNVFTDITDDHEKTLT